LEDLETILGNTMLLNHIINLVSRGSLVLVGNTIFNFHRLIRGKCDASYY